MRRRNVRPFLVTALSASVVGPLAGSPLPPFDPASLDPPRLVVPEDVLDALRGSGPPMTPAVETYDVDHYDIDLQVLLNGLTAGVQGIVRVQARALTNDLGSIVLDLDAALRCTGVEVDGTAGVFRRDGARLIVDLGTPRAHDEAFEVAVYYLGTPPRRGFGSFAVYEHDGFPIVQTLSEPSFAHTWWPCKDRPNDKATVSMHATVPLDLVVGSNGVLRSVEPTADGRHTYHWESSYPIATYLVSLAITNYVVLEDTYDSGARVMPITHFVFPEDAAAAALSFAVVPDQIAAFAERFGEYPFLDDKYGHAEFIFSGAMEHQTLTSYGQGFVQFPNDLIAAHELAHQWWGDCVTLADFRNVWLNEGFATYGEAVWLEASQGRTAYLQYFLDRNHLPLPGPVYDPDPSQLFSSTVYIKGAFVLHMLRHVVGDDAFFEILRAYRQAHAYESASTRDFVETASTVAGTDLDWFFDQWLRRDGRPAYDYTWHVTRAGAETDPRTGGRGAGSTQIAIEIRQLQDEPYRVPLPVWLYTPTGVTEVSLEVDEPLESFTVEAPGPVDNVVLDPEGWVLKWIGPPPALAQHPTLAAATPTRASWAAPNPFVGGTRLVTPGRDTARPYALRIFDATGRLVGGTSSEAASVAGIPWDGRDLAGRRLASGVYLYEVVAGNARYTGKVSLR